MASSPAWCLSLLVLLATSSALVSATLLYPASWMKLGECLDLNVGPLKKGVVPQVNRNVLDVMKVDGGVDGCVTACMNNTKCSYFTYYAFPQTQAVWNSSAGCKLVGYNLKTPCFSMSLTCVLLQECQFFDGNCTTCKTGMRPLLDPSTEPLTLVIGGVTDDRNYQTDGNDQYTTSTMVELIADASSSCALTNDGLSPRFGAAAGWVGDKVVVVGGYDDNSSTYLSTCEELADPTASWQPCTGNLTTARAYPGYAFVPAPAATDGTTVGVFYVAGGYSDVTGFLDSVEAYDNDTDSFVVASFVLPQKMSHFCLVPSFNDSNGNSYLYLLGGWNVSYLSSVYQLQMDPATGLQAANAKWKSLKPMMEARSDMACMEAQVSWWQGIMAAGGYNVDGAWMATIEFFRYDTGAWVPLFWLPNLNTARHYHGLTTVGLLPMVFGGWSNGSLASTEMLDDSILPWNWDVGFSLQARREKFAYTRVPNDFAFCP